MGAKPLKGKTKDAIQSLIRGDLLGKLFYFILLLNLQSHFSFADCSQESKDENFILKVDYFTFKNMQAVGQRYNEVYESGRRLRNRVYQNQQNEYVIDKLKGPQQIPLSFLTGLRQQLELALERHYGEYLFYPDLGHAHLLIPTDESLKNKDLLSLSQKLASQNLVLLYHTAELIEMKKDFLGPLTNDPWLQWRYYSRNFISPINEARNLAVLISDEKKYNTVRRLPGFSEVGRVYFSASAQGCLQLRNQGKVIQYDLNFD